MVDQTPLTNADFRKLLQTPRRTPAGDTSSNLTGQTPRRQAGDKPKPKKPAPRPKPQIKDEDDEPKYRDRAEERRRGVNPDYAGVTQYLNTVQGADLDPSKLSVEETKYLGGDLEHTHLVKGLDFQLLEKMRTAPEKEEDEQEEVKEVKKKEELSIKHTTAKGVYAALFEPKRTNVHEHFLPKRTAFVFDFEPDEMGIVQDIPTTLRRSKADCPAAVKAVFAKVDNAVIERIAKIMSYIKTGAGGGKKIKKKERDEILGELIKSGPGGGAAAGSQGRPGAVGSNNGAAGKMPPPPPPPGAGQAVKKESGDDDDDNIFEDAGTDYKPSVTGKKKPQPSKADGDDMDIDNEQAMGPPPPPPPPQAGQDQYYQYGADQYGRYGGYGQDQQYNQQGYGAYGYGQDQQYAQGMPHAVQAAHQAGHDHTEPQQEKREDVPKWRVRTRKAEERQVDFVDDAYGEYYPMAGGFEVPTLEEEDDADVEGKKAQKEALAPKPDAGDGENVQKINNQLHKIENIMKQKGHDHSAAFGKTPSRLATGDDPNISVHKEKRRRI